MVRNSPFFCLHLPKQNARGRRLKAGGRPVHENVGELAGVGF